MSSPSSVHPVSGKPRNQYITLVLERCDDTDTYFPIDDIANSLTFGSESKTFPGYRVVDMSHGDFIASFIHRFKEDQS